MSWEEPLKRAAQHVASVFGYGFEPLKGYHEKDGEQFVIWENDDLPALENMGIILGIIERDTRFRFESLDLVKGYHVKKGVTYGMRITLKRKKQ